MNIPTLCNKIVECLAQIDPYSAEQVKKPLPNQELKKQLDSLSCKVPNDVIELYQWCNGNHGGNCFIAAQYYMLSIEQIIEIYHDMGGSFAILDLYEMSGKVSDVYDKSLTNEDVWDRNWIPILCHSNYSRFWVVCVEEDKSPVIFVDPEENYIQELYPSLKIMLQAELEYFQSVLSWAKKEGIYPKDLYPPYNSDLDTIRYKYGFKEYYLYSPL